MKPSRLLALVVAAPLGAAVVERATAASVADFYHGQTLTLYDFSSGGGSDILAHILANYMRKYIPGNPVIVVKSMIGAAGLLEANYLYNSAPRDGTVFGMLNRGVAFAPVFGAKGARFDATKFNWMGNASREILLGASWHTSPVKTMDDARKTELIVGATAPDGELAQMPAMLNATTGTKFKIVTGYSGGAEILVAMERGEVGGRMSWTYGDLSTTKPDWLRDGKINVLFQSGHARDPRLPNVPLALDYAVGPTERRILELLFSKLEMARPYTLPPDVPADRVEAMQNAFMSTLRDKEFLAAVEKAGIEIDASDGKETSAIVEQAATAPPDVISRIRAILGAK